MPANESAAAAARRDAARAHRCFVLCLAAKNRRERLRWFYEMERLRSEALAKALLSPDYRSVLADVSGLLDELRAKTFRAHAQRRGSHRREWSPRDGTSRTAAVQDAANQPSHPA